MSDAQAMIHVRFAPNGSVTEIGERPESTLPQEWFNFLSTKIGQAYQPLSGGRGIFRVARSELDRFKAALAAL